MTSYDSYPVQVAELRRRIEDIGEQPPRRLKDQQALHQMQVYQSKLELQNEHLRRAAAELRASEQRYHRLFESMAQ